MLVSNFLFPESRTPEDDGRVIRETLEEARLTDRLGFDVIWLAEHHFDGICAYVDPVSFAAALAVATEKAHIGFAVAQMALHHPTRFAEQMALIDHLSGGRLIVGLGRGTAYNIYDYQGFGIDPGEAQARFEEAEAIMRAAWTGRPLDHRGRFFQLKLPALRPAPFTRPHPPIIRAAATEHGMLDIARRGQPFMLNVQSTAVIAERMRLYRAALAETGLDAARIEALVAQCWVWRNVVVAPTDAEAERIAVPAFTAMNQHRAAMRERVLAEQGVSIAPGHASAPSVAHQQPGSLAAPSVAHQQPGSLAAPSVAHQQPARTSIEHGLVYGAPATVLEQLMPIQATGVGGLIIQFRLGPMSLADTSRSLELFRDQVAPRLKGEGQVSGP